MIFFLLLQVVFAYNETISRQSAYLSHLTYCDINTCDNCIVEYVVENEGSLAIKDTILFPIPFSLLFAVHPICITGSRTCKSAT